MTFGALLVGAIGGFASALMFAAVTGGGALGAPLVMASPLPVAIAGLGWGSRAGALAAVAAAAAVAGLTHPTAGLVFLLVVVAPAAWYAHQIGLARPRDPADAAAGLEWYPLDRVFLAITVITPLSLVAAGLLLGFDVDAAAGDIADALTEMATASGGTDELPPRDDLVAGLTFYVRLMPATVAMLWLSTMVLDLALAARIVRISGRLRRPPETIARAFGLPKAAVAVLVAAAILAVTDLPVALAAGAVAGALAMAFAVQGFAVIHVKLASHPGRVAILAVLYGATFILSIPLIAALAIGIADCFADLRRRSVPSV